jgi:hypothetical protein
VDAAKLFASATAGLDEFGLFLAEMAQLEQTRAGAGGR